MSRETESVDAEAGTGFEGSVVDLWRKWYDLPVLAALTAFMLWVRLQGYDKLTKNGEVFFSGNDAYYHYRSTAYTVRHWPFTMDFDVWTNFPFGTSQGQFGTLFDQIMATAALIVGLGNPSDQTIKLVVMVTPAVMGALAAVPVYYIGQRLGGRLGGLFGVLILALLPGTFLQRSVVGFADHQVAEVFFQAFAIAILIVAVSVAQRELPVYEQVLDRDWQGLREPAKWSAFTGIAIGLYMWVWPPGIVLIGILGLFFTVALSVDYVRGRSPEHLAFVGVVSMAVTFVMLVIQFDTLEAGTTRVTPLHLVLTLGVGAGCAFMAGLARVWDQQNVDERYYPAAVGGILAAGVTFMAVALPDLFGLIRSNLGSILLFSQSESALTVQEVQSVVPSGPNVTIGDQLGAINSFMYGEYGLAYVTAYLAIIWMIAHLYTSDYRAEDVFVIIYTVFVTLMALTQIRFNYYLVIGIVAMNAWLFGRIVDVVGVPSVRDSLDEIEVYQVLAVLTIFVVVVAPLAPPLAASSFQEAQQRGVPVTAIEAGDGYARASGQTWANTGDWMQNSTPEEGEYGGANNRMEYYGAYGETGDFAYPDGAYGVLSWWDYGHWITVFSKRIPVANPFQQNPKAVSAFYQASSEERAELVVETLPAMQGRQNEYDELSKNELREIKNGMSDQQDSEDVRYVMIDDQSAASKFYAIAQWSGPASKKEVDPRSVYVRGLPLQIGGRNVTARTYNQKYRETMMYKLYFRDASGLSHYRLVHESSKYSIVGGLTNGQQSVALTSRDFTNGWDSRAQNVSRSLTQSRRFGRPVRFGGNLYVYNAHLESDLKTYERVEGATITGQITNATENTSVFVTLQLETGPGRTFRYVQQAQVDAQGNFNVTVPYSTNNELTPEDGATNETVLATGDYRLLVSPQRGFPRPVGNFSVPETAIYEGTEIDVGTYQKPETRTPGGDGNSSDGGNSSGSSDGSSSGSGDGSGSLVAPPVVAPSPAAAPRTTSSAVTVRASPRGR